MNQTDTYSSARSSVSYKTLLDNLYGRARARPADITVPAIRAIAVRGNEAPASAQYREAVSALYAVGYALKMGLKSGALPRPRGYFDYRIGALETRWWSEGGGFDIANPRTLRWQAYLMVPAFVTRRLFAAALKRATARNPELALAKVSLERIKEGRCAQLLHVGPYDAVGPSIATLNAFIGTQGLKPGAPHHEIYLSDPRRSAPGRLRTVIRVPMQQ